MKIAYNTWSMATVPYQAFIPGLADIGYTAIAISVVPGYTIGGQYVPNAGNLDALDADDRRRIREGLSERGLELASVVGNQPLVGIDQTRAEASLQRLRQTIDACLELMPPGQAAPPTMNTGAAGRSDQFEAERNQLADRLRQLAEYAAARGITVCLEPHVGGAIDTLERAEWIVQTVDSPALRLDFDVSHFEVVGVPMEDSVRRLVPLSAAAEIKDQHLHYMDSGPIGPDWHVPGNGVGSATAPDGREVTFQFLLGGEGIFDLPRYLELMRECGFTRPIAFEASVQCQARPDYDALAVAASVYRWMERGWRTAGVLPAASSV